MQEPALVLYPQHCWWCLAAALVSQPCAAAAVGAQTDHPAGAAAVAESDGLLALAVVLQHRLRLQVHLNLPAGAQGCGLSDCVVAGPQHARSCAGAAAVGRLGACSHQ